jgi:thioredoxin-dependent peroxiredoxin
VGGIYGGGHQVKFSELAGSTLVLYFYPENDTPGCTIQACDLRDSWRDLQSKVELFGVSVDSVESHQEFIKKHGLPFPLLSDSDHEIMKAYQVWSEEHTVTERTTYLIGADRKIKAILKNVNPSEHVTNCSKHSLRSRCRIYADAANEHAFDFEAGTENHQIGQLAALNAAHIAVDPGEFSGRKRSHANDIWEVLPNRPRHSLHHPIHSMHRTCEAAVLALY